MLLSQISSLVLLAGFLRSTPHILISFFLISSPTFKTYNWVLNKKATGARKRGKVLSASWRHVSKLKIRMWDDRKYRNVGRPLKNSSFVAIKFINAFSEYFNNFYSWNVLFFRLKNMMRLTKYHEKSAYDCHTKVLPTTLLICTHMKYWNKILLIRILYAVSRYYVFQVTNAMKITRMSLMKLIICVAPQGQVIQKK